jgi:hypothetical protein
LPDPVNQSVAGHPTDRYLGVDQCQHHTRDNSYRPDQH